MRRTDEEILIRGSAERLYGDGQPVWDPNDQWNLRKRGAIDRFAQVHVATLLAKGDTVLDAGCGNQPYSWMPTRAISLDRFWKQVVGRSNPVAGDLERLPFGDGVMDAVVCVASVLNYVSAAEAIGEIARVTKPGGHLLLHFETSSSFEHLGGARWAQPVVRLETINAGKADTLWIYRPSYIEALLRVNGFRIHRRGYFHILSALGLRLGLPQQHAAALALLDGVAGFASQLADDVILLAEKHA